MQEADEGTTHVLEAIILSIVLLGAAYGVASMREEGGVISQPRAKLAVLTEDALLVLEGLREERGRLLDLFLVEAYHCIAQTVEDAPHCEGTRSANISLKIESYLPAGAGYSFGIGNGVAQKALYTSYLPEGETVTASRAIVPDWNMTFLSTELSCYDLTTSVGVYALPIWHGGAAEPALLNFTATAYNVTAAVFQDEIWNATFHVPRLPADLITTFANGTDGTYPGATSYSFCDLGGMGTSLLAARNATVVTHAAEPARVGSTSSFAYDLGALHDLPGVTVLTANVTLFEPLAPNGVYPDSYIPVVVVPIMDRDGTATWSVPANSLYGLHPALLSAKVRLANGVVLDVHKLDSVAIALPTGEVPIDPPYRVYLQAWFPDWR